MDNFLMTRSEVCSYLGISVSRLRQLERDNVIRPYMKLEGGKKLYSSTEVYNHMKTVWTGGDK